MALVIARVIFAPVGAVSDAGTSFLCVKPPTQRTAIGSTNGTNAQCDGALALDGFSHFAAHPTALGAPLQPGSAFYVQGWFRDPPSAKATQLSDALEFGIQPLHVESWPRISGSLVTCR